MSMELDGINDTKKLRCEEETCCRVILPGANPAWTVMDFQNFIMRSQHLNP